MFAVSKAKIAAGTGEVGDKGWGGSFKNKSFSTK